MRVLRTIVVVAVLFCCRTASSDAASVDTEAGGKPPALQQNKPIRLWHGYRGAERDAIERLARDFTAAHPEWPVEPLAVPYEAFANKLTSAIPRGHGPDLFIAAHERLGDWAESGLVSPLAVEAEEEFFPATLDALTWKGTRYGKPLAFKSVALFARTDLLRGRGIPADTDALLATCRDLKARRPDVFCLAYETGSFYHHAAWLFGFGGGIFDDAGGVALDRPANARSAAFVRDLQKQGFVPEEPTAALVAQLFNEGRVAMVVNGPWFLGEIGAEVPFRVDPLPRVTETGLPATPFLTVEGVLMSARAQNPDGALALARFLATGDGARRRLVEGRQAVAWAPAYDDPALDVDPLVRRFRDQVAAAVPMPNHPLMRSVWEPASQALRSVLRGDQDPEQALRAAQQRVRIATRPIPPPADPTIPLVLAGVAMLVVAAWLVRRARREDVWARMRRSGNAYAYLAPAALATMVLVFVPFAVGTAVSLFSHRQGDFTYVGLANYVGILAAQDYAITDPLSFYFTLAVTVMWTAANVFLHVTIGLSLALLLRAPWMRLRGVYRVLLIVPWAVPNYITALIWKGMFHKQFGAINGLLTWLGLEPVSWFSHFWTAFAANVTTNTWLGFPFMMVVTLGALQSIPTDLEEAAEVDGASPAQRFFSITLPLLKPALLPAVVLGSVWTFNMFNIIYLVSGGEPDGATEILITEAYRWAFTRQEQYGVAAAYATLIFLVLLAAGRGTKRLQGGTA